jgi:hypothetical protein
MAESRELQIISRLTRPDSSVNTAVQELLDLTSVAVASTTTSISKALFTHLNNTWKALMENIVANTGPSQQAALVEFVRTLQQQKVIDPATGGQLRFDQDYNKTLWTEVPSFGITVADHWNFGTHLNTILLFPQHIVTTTTILRPQQIVTRSRRRGSIYQQGRIPRSTDFFCREFCP